MADQPERPIEKLLRECGKRQLPAEAFELHPANRRLLQAEVARAYPKKQQRLSWFGPHLLPKLAWGLCAFSIVGLAAWLSLRSNHETTSNSLMARNEKALTPASSVTSPVAAPSEEPSPVVQSNVFLADSLTTAPQQLAANRSLSVQSPPALQADASSAVSMNLAEQELSKDATAKGEFAAATLASAPEQRPAAGTPMRYGLASSAAPVLKQSYESPTVQNFVRAQAQATKTKTNQEQPAQPILASFRLERSGSDIRIIDQDGSVYLGVLEAPQSQIRLKTERTDQPVYSDSAGAIAQAKKSSPAGSSEEYGFQVVGTNRTLRELVSFNGKWSAFTNAPSLVPLAQDVNRGLASDRQILGAAPLTITTHGRISGTAVINGSNAITINAISVQP